MGLEVGDVYLEIVCKGYAKGFGVSVRVMNCDSEKYKQCWKAPTQRSESGSVTHCLAKELKYNKKATLKKKKKIHSEA